MSIKSKLISLIPKIFRYSFFRFKISFSLTSIFLFSACESDSQQSMLSSDQSMISNDQSILSSDQSILSSDQSILSSDQSILSSDQSVVEDELQIKIDDCQSLCVHLMDCATSQCMPTDLNLFQSNCQEICLESSIFRRIGIGLDSCDDLLTFSAQQIPMMVFESLDCQSDPANPPMLMACDTFASNYIRCLSDQCSPQDDMIEDTLMRAYAHYCNEQAQKGALNADQLALIAGDQSSCEMGILANMISERISVSMMGTRGDLMDYCENGPINPIEICEQACQRLSPCIPVDHEFAVLRNQDRCAELCLAHTDPSSQTWLCLSTLNLYDCASIPSCY